MQSNTNSLSISIIFFAHINLFTLTKDAAMQLIIHHRGKDTRIKKPLVMEKLYQQLGRGHVHITFIK
jgi:hypothetical protein